MINNWKKITAFQKSMQYEEPVLFSLYERRRHYVLGLYAEVGELLNSFSWKPWGDTKAPDIANIEREIVDCLFFLHHIAESFNVSAEDLEKRFEQVLKNNKFRYSAKEDE